MSEAKVSKKKIYVTKDYDSFKKLKGNRDITAPRVKKILKSLDAVGYITNPIIVNEKMEVIDGQARVEAFREMGIPVEYVIHPGAGGNECTSLNINQTNWTDRDYIKYFADQGNMNFIRLKGLLDEFKDSTAITLCAAMNSLVYSGGATSKAIHDEQVICTEKDLKRARFELAYLTALKDVVKEVGGRTEYIKRALLYAYRSLNTEQRNELAEKLRLNVYCLPAFTKIEDYLRYFDQFYNKGKAKKNKINLRVQYETDKI